MPDRVKIAAHAKVNLFLRILSRETSGFHGLETAFGLLELADELVVSRQPTGITLTVHGPDTGPPEQNLAYRAAKAQLAATGDTFGVKIELTKHIPVQAGLGGGSSDAAAVLHGINALAGNAVPQHELVQIASRLGADVPFFASAAPFAVAWNHGERLFRLPAPPTAPVLIVVPHVKISTPEAFGWFDAATIDIGSRGTVIFEPDAFEAWGSIGRMGGNDFESIVFHRHPDLRTTFERLAETRPLLLRMSGSGSAMFAVYQHAGALEDAAMMLTGGSFDLIRTATRATAAPAPTPDP